VTPRKRAAPPVSEADLAGLSAALEEAQRAAAIDEVPVGAVVARNGQFVSRAHNETVTHRNPTLHAELLAIQRAIETLKADRLDDCTLYVTLEPCAQCAGSVVLAKLGRLVFGAYDPKAGMCGSVGDLVRHSGLNHRTEVIGGVREADCGALLTRFFGERR
jgi:tRNA(adenine34) deaminase